MKRAIYVGPNTPGFCYGMTGEVTSLSIDEIGDPRPFFADGWNGKCLVFNRRDIYIPSEDATRYCPPLEKIGNKWEVANQKEIYHAA